MSDSEIFPEEILNSTVESHIIKHNKKTSLLFVITFVALLIAIVSLPFIGIDIYTTSRGNIIPQEKKLTLYSPISGKISFFNIDENQKIKKGDTLLIIDHNILKERENLNTVQSSENSLYLNDLKNLIHRNYNQIQSDQYKRELLKHQQELYNLDVIIKNTQSDFNRKEHLYQKEVISKSEFEKAQLDLDKIKNDRINLIKQTELSWQKEYTQLSQDNKSIHSNQKQLKEEENNYIIISPIDGELINMQGFHKGSGIAAGNPIVEISPDKDIIVETFVNPSEIGFLREGGDAIYQIDAFNSNQWGFARGKIIEISKDILIVNNVPYYKIKSSLDKNSLSLKNGAKGNLKKGMSLTSRFFLTKRTAFQLLFDKVDDWFNPYNNKNE
ncbi:HlyD family efflux transporter periplasmic adaptor subunit [Flavobacterium sp. GA093]|uniref:HlyD family efflux transporter periplasmic adaptor subunit n=1 Tax=Flavobacterium hydrocarbonoxydans TaxID=2683249 RepID=A0A6I4NNC2_9FLAO|nr:HlyD family efflux transporter periplasmic adaptor subunit [Flavobacterium hydrocarbonoxydans]MWB95928.1 HlyD family efflux transporter periplasmic adaptor subunit [Flavobacterium hydrocarbonoxydans]